MNGGRERLRVEIGGAVQGVGFRPFVYRLARELGLAGWVNNSGRGVTVEVEGTEETLGTFLLRLEEEKPPRASIQSLEPVFLDRVGYDRFEIRESEEGGEKRALVLPDIATCGDCLREIFDPEDRRYRYPFTNCTNCGPRYSIIEALPYDRPHTTMKRFALCAACRAEYGDPEDRRFHAQPNACPACGPHLELWDGDGRLLHDRDEGLAAAAEEIRRGAVVAIKGLGGFHLMVDACSDEGVGRLRAAKNREEKPLALMYPSLEMVQSHCELSPAEVRLLGAPEAPIALLKRRDADGALARGVAPGNPYLGVMLPYTPLHHLLLAELGKPVVATSGNRADEPICTDEGEALRRLGGIADRFLVHDRPIRRHVDDSIARVIAGRELVLRRGRGYAPLPVHLTAEGADVVAVGAHLKNAVALAVGREAFVSQHIGDLETVEAHDAFRTVGADLQRLYEASPQVVACDLHPDYLSSRFAAHLESESGLRRVEVQHHFAHVLSCMAENRLVGEVLGIAWDGTGYGTDRTVWGGEFLLATEASFRRVAHLRTFRLPGGDRAVKEPRRSGLGLLFEIFGEELLARIDLEPVRAFAATELKVIGQMLRRSLNAPLTSSAGRLFDAVASMVGLRQQIRFEGQGAMELEFVLEEGVEEGYEVVLREGSGESAVVDWEPMVRQILEELEKGVPVGRIAARFHNGLVEGMVAVAGQVGQERVLLTGGCMQNRYLTERAVRRLQEEGFRPYWHQRVPPNDGGIALGQVVAARSAAGYQ